MRESSIKASSKTKKDFEFLVGSQFSVDGKLYTVQGLQQTDHELLVEAEHGEDLVVFPVEQTMNALLVEEDIEFFNPNYLTAR